jgi:tetratricopeptide (TPR) repeat protein
MIRSASWIAKRAALISLTVASVISAQSADTPAQAKQHYQNAVAAINKNDWQTAKTELQQAEKLAPQNALVHYDLALAYSHTGSPISAQTELTKALQLGLPPEQKQAAEQLRQKLANADQGEESRRAPEDNGPSYEETVAYINKVLKDYPTASFSNSKCFSELGWGQSIEGVVDGYISIYENRLGDGSKGCGYVKYRVPAGQVSILIHPYEGFGVCFQCPGGSECIYRDKEPQTGHCLLIAATLEQAQRLDRAVKHLVELVKPEEPKVTDPFAH